MSTLGKLLAPKPIRRPFNLVNNVNNNANNNPKKSSVNMYRYSMKQSRIDLKSNSQLAYLNTASTLRDSELFFSNIESDLEQDGFRQEICSILTQQEDKIPFTLCDEECSNDCYREELQDVERVQNPFGKNFDLNEDSNDDENVVNGNERSNDICPFSNNRMNVNEGEGEEEGRVVVDREEEEVDGDDKEDKKDVEL